MKQNLYFFFSFGSSRIKLAYQVSASLRMKNSNGIKSPDGTDASETTILRPKLETFDDVLPYVGDFGRYQWLLLVALLPYSVAYAVLYFSQFFLTLLPQEHWCKIEELVFSNFTQEER